MLKSSDVANAVDRGERRWMLVPQSFVGQDTTVIARLAPKTWRYLQDHAALLDRRGSSIYKGQPPFSIFGVGDYSYSDWKVAISGFYKRLQFTLVRPLQNKPVMLDDTCYFLPCDSQIEAETLVSILNSTIASEFFSAFLFWDAKRPITVDLLRRLSLPSLAMELGIDVKLLGKWGIEDRQEAPRKRHAKALTATEPQLW